MSTLMQYAPIINMAVIIGGGILLVIRMNDVLKRVVDSNEKLMAMVQSVDKRLTVLETVCAIQHGHDRERPIRYAEVEA